MSASAAAPVAAASTAAGVCCASNVLRTRPKTSSLLRTEPLPTACIGWRSQAEQLPGRTQHLQGCRILH